MMQVKNTLEDTISSLRARYMDECGDIGLKNFNDVLSRAAVLGNTSALVNSVNEIIRYAGSKKVSQIDSYLSSIEFIEPKPIQPLKKAEHNQPIQTPRMTKMVYELDRRLSAHNLRVSENTQTLKSFYQ